MNKEIFNRIIGIVIAVCLVIMTVVVVVDYVSAAEPIVSYQIIDSDGARCEILPNNIDINKCESFYDTKYQIDTIRCVI